MSHRDDAPDRADDDVLRARTRWLRRLALDLTRDEDLADDLVQDTLVKLINRPRHIDPAGDGWLRTVLRNLHIDRMRMRSRRDPDRWEIPTPDVTIAAPDDDVDAARIMRALEREIDALSEPFRTTLRLSYYEDLSSADVAKRLGVPAATVRRRNQLALEQLRKRIAPHADEGDKRSWRRLLAPLVQLRNLARSLLGGMRAPLLGTAAASLLAVVVLDRGDTEAAQHAQISAGHADRRAFADAAGARLTSGQVEKDAVERPVSPAQPRTATAISPRADAEVEPGPSCPSLQSLVDAAPTGALVEVPPCLYREGVVITRPVILAAQPGAELRGSDVWTNFTPHAPGGFVSLAKVPIFRATRGGNCHANTVGPCTGVSQVYLDGQALERVGPAGVPGPSQFAITPDRHVVLGRDPRGHLVEVTIRQVWVKVRASDVTIRGFRMRHAVTQDHIGAIDVDRPHERLLVTENVLSDATGTIVSLAGARQALVDNDIFGAGAVGVVLRAPERIQVIGNRIFHNGTAPEKRTGWLEGGVRAYAGSLELVGNEIFENVGAGFSCSFCDGVVSQANLMRDNGGAGVRLYVAQRGEIDHNQIWRNGWGAAPQEPALMLVDAHALAVKGNIVVENPGGLLLRRRNDRAFRPDFTACLAPSGNDVRDNVVIASGLEDSLRILDTTRPDDAHCPDNRISGNRLWDRALADARSVDRVSLRGFAPIGERERDELLRIAGLGWRR